MRKERKDYTAEEKLAILRRHLLDKVPVSDLNPAHCDTLSFYASSRLESICSASQRVASASRWMTAERFRNPGRCEMHQTQTFVHPQDFSVHTARMTCTSLVFEIHAQQGLSATFNLCLPFFPR